MFRLAAAMIVLALLPATPHATAQQVAPSPAPSSKRLFRFRQLRFSPNGQYVVAQEASAVTVLALQPFRVLFSVPAQNVTSLEFTPDSRQIAFVSATGTAESFGSSGYHRLKARGTPRLERWSIEDRVRVDSLELRLRSAGTSELSPDGRVLAAVDFDGTFRLVDVGSGGTIFEKRKFCQRYVDWGPGQTNNGWRGDPGSASLRFSPDSRFILALPKYAVGAALAFDLTERKVVNLEGGLRKFGRRPEFAFLTSDRMMVSEGQRPAVTMTVDCKSCRQWDPPGPADPSTVTATFLAFPSGEVLSQPLLPPGPLFRAANPDFVIIRPFGIDYRPEAKQTTVTDTPMAKMTAISYPPSNRAAAVEFATGQVIVSDTPALDVFGRFYVAELANGDLGLYERGKGLQATLTVELR